MSYFNRPQLATHQEATIPSHRAARTQPRPLARNTTYEGYKLKIQIKQSFHSDTHWVYSLARRAQIVMPNFGLNCRYCAQQRLDILQHRSPSSSR